MGTASLAAAVPWQAWNADGEGLPSTPGAQDVLSAFDYKGVKLLDGRFLRQVEATRETYAHLSNDDILKGFRRRAGMPAPGKDLKGWARDTCDATFGQWLSGMARLSCALNDSMLREKAVFLAEGWKATLGPGGDCRMGTYQWEKMACGLVDMALYAGYDQELDLLEKITGWASRHFDRSRSSATLQDRDGRRPHGTLEWYTLTENAYRAYLLTGKSCFKEFGDLWLYPVYWNKFENSFSPADVAYLHSYSHINTFCGAAMAYAVTGHPRYLRILENGYRYAVQTQAYASGGYGPGEWSVPPNGLLGDALEIRSDCAEIPCGSWAAFKISRYLQRFTGQAGYADWMESFFYNGIGASLPVLPDGRSFYYADYRIGTATKLYHWDEWPCCSGTYIQSVADYHNIIFLHDQKGLYVNLFVPSEVKWQHQGREIGVRMETLFPNEDRVQMLFQCMAPVKMSLSLRMPPWSTGLEIQVNNEPQFKPACNASGWLPLERVWQPGDVIRIKLNPQLRICPVDAQHPRRCAIKYGPLLLAQDALFTYPLKLEGDDPASKLVRESGELKFRVDDGGGGGQLTGAFMPFYDVPERVPYRVYFDLDRPRFL